MNQEPSIRFYNNDAHEQKPSENQEQSDEQMNYYNQYCRLFLANVVLSTQLKELNNQKNQLLSKLSKLQKKADQISQGNSGNFDQKKRRIRRSASEIARHYRCQVEGCTKSYGSEGSLNQHIKIKHPEIYGLVSHNMASSNHTVKESQQESDQQS